MNAVMNRPLSIGKVALTVRDLDRVSRFYQDVLGFRLASSDAASRLTVRDAWGTSITVAVAGCL
nr:VOC family protein [uncultured Rhodopila sp.]